MAEASVTVTIVSKLGMHAGPAVAFAEAAAAFESDIVVSRVDDGQSANGKSLLSMLTLLLTQGTEIRITATGDDAQTAVDELKRFMESKFGAA
jgi:phosphotransferase system HPr (HPr) family protein